MQKFKNNLFTFFVENLQPNSKYLIWPLLLLFFYALEIKFGLRYLIFIPGLICLAYLPGFLINKTLKITHKEKSVFLDLGFNIFSSISILAISQFIFQSHFSLNQNDQIYLIVAINFFIWLATLIYLFIFPMTFPQIKKVKKIKWIYWLVFFIPFIIFSITLFFDPYVDNADHYLTSIKYSIMLGENIRDYSRQFYVPFVSLLFFITDISLVWLYKIFLSLLFYISGVFWFYFCLKHIAKKEIAFLIYLLILGAAVIPIEVNIIRPQIMILIFMFPILVLLIEALINDNYKFSLTALFYSVVSLGFHELGFVLFLISLITNLIVFIKLIFINHKIKIKLKHIILALIIIYPYFIIFNPQSFFGSLIRMAKVVISKFPGFNWQWWFLDNYQTIDGVQLGWQGVYAGAYYLYNGILILLLALILAIGLRKKIKYFYAVPVLILIFIYFIFAELLPRFGYFFLPNRAWPFLILGVIIFIAWAFSFLKNYSFKILLTLRVILVSLILMGIGATFYLTINKMGTVYKEEMPALKFIDNNLPQKSIILTSQENINLFEFYSKNHYIAKIDFDLENKNLTKNIFYQKINGFNEDKYFNPVVIGIPEIIKNIITQKNGVVVGEEEIVTQAKKELILPAYFENKGSRYFFYSFAKNKGIGGQREHRKEKYNDASNYQFFKNYTGSDVAYKDANAIIIKVE